MAELDIAVIIVTYKSARLTVGALRSVATERKTAGLQIRAVVIDNASGDAPEVTEAIKSNAWDDWASVVISPKNGGFSYGNNLGIERAYSIRRPDYVYLMNPDAQVRARAIGTLVRFLEAHPEVGIAGSSFEDFDGSEWPIAFRFPGMLSELSAGLQIGLISRLLRRWETARVMTHTSQPTDWICGASMMIRPAVFDAVGGFDENYFLYFEETDFCYRARQAGYPTWYVPESRVMHIRGQSTKVTDLSDEPKRLPAYWFASRRRYFYVTFGVGRAMAIDIVAVLAHSLGRLKRLLRRRRDTTATHFVRDLLAHTILRPGNRDFPPMLCSASFGRYERQ
jgi:N-acetylglucosaminyl-diphospho-decaprenol L-rhamnosyltransferase